MPPITISCTLRNSALENVIANVTDEVLRSQIVTNRPLGPSDTVELSLIANESETGSATYWANGYGRNRNDNVSKGDFLDLP